MGQVTLQINGRTYRLRCDDGQEDRLNELGDHLAHHVKSLKEDVGHIGEDRLLLMAGLMVADELWDARDEIASLKKKGGKLKPPKIAKEIEIAAERVEALKEKLVKTDDEAC